MSEEKQREKLEPSAFDAGVLLQSAQTPIFWKDAARRFAGANRAFLDYFGFADEKEILGKTDEEMGWHSNPEPYRADELAVLREGVSTSSVPGTCVVNGQERQIVASKSPVRKNGKIIGLIGCFEDVTEIAQTRKNLIAAQKAAERTETLKWENERLGRIINNVPAGICVCLVKDGTPHEVTINRHMAQRLGQPEDASRLCTLEELIDSVHGEDRERYQRDLAAFLRQQERLDGTYRLKVRDTGSYIWAHVEGNLVVGPDGMGVAYLACTDVTPLADATARLRESRQRYEQTVDTMQIAMWTYDIPNHRIVMGENAATAALREKFGWPQVFENAPQSTLPIIEESDRERYLAAFREVEAGRDASCEVWYKTDSAAEPHCEREFYHVVLDGDGKPLAAFGIGQNITAEKKAEESYRKELTYLRENSDWNLIAKRRNNLTKNIVLENTPVSEKAYPLPDGCSYDDAIRRLYGLVADRSARNALMKLFSRENLIRRFRRGETVTRADYKRTVPDKPPFWFSATVRTQLVPGTGDIESFTYTYDVTENRVRSQVFTKLGDLGYDEIGLIFPNSGECRVFLSEVRDIPRSETGGRYEDRLNSLLLHAISPEERETLRKALSLETVLGVLEKERVYLCPGAVMQRDGTIRQKMYRCSWLDAEQDALFYAISDTTDQQAAEQRQIARIEAAKLEAERANEAKSAFLSSMSHDLRTPLNGVLGFAEIAMREPDPEKKQKYLEKIHFSGGLLLDLVNDTLELSRIESGKMTLNPEVVDSAEMGRTVLETVRQNAAAKGVRLIADVDTFPGGLVRVDKLKLQKVLLNLLSNAVKYTPAGGTIRYSVMPIEPAVDGCTRRYVVEDNGIGMSAEFLTHLYEPFSQEQRPESADVMGTGLGLSIVKRIVDLMGGKIEVQSKLHGGTRFTVSLPVPPAADGERQTSAKPRSTVSLRGKRLLLCEDNPINAEIASILLGNQQIVTDCAVNGREGVQKFQNSPPDYYDAVLMDIRMPVMDGLEAARRIRGLQRPDAATVPIIAMTADAFAEDLRRAGDAGMDDYLTKPIEPDKLMNVLRKHLK
jgi:PAS domain S-box-containing protein